MYSIIMYIYTSNLLVYACNNKPQPIVYLSLCSWLLIVNVRGFPCVNICMVKHAMICERNRVLVLQFL